MHFVGEVVTKWLQHSGDDRYMELQENFTFVDDNNTEWLAPAGHRINGASIPEIVWSTVGSPFIGDYRRASVIHDVECDLRRNSSKRVHRMFYNAMICDGVPKLKAKYMYKAVRLFGPKWDDSKSSMKSIFTGIAGYDQAILNQDLDLDIEELEAKLDNLLDEYK